MRKSAVIGIVALGSFMAILFNPADSKYWIYFLILGIVFGIIWFIVKK